VPSVLTRPRNLTNRSVSLPVPSPSWSGTAREIIGDAITSQPRACGSVFEDQYSPHVLLIGFELARGALTQRWSAIRKLSGSGYTNQSSRSACNFDAELWAQHLNFVEIVTFEEADLPTNCARGCRSPVSQGKSALVLGRSLLEVVDNQDRVGALGLFQFQA
jgi:hypothetical protein